MCRFNIRAYHLPRRNVQVQKEKSPIFSFSLFVFYSPSNSTRCIECPLGYYSAEGTADECLSCPRGKKCPDKAELPVDCFPGEYSTGNSSACRVCPPGFECPVTTELPSICPEGYYATENSTNCTICSAGFYCPHAGTPLPIR